MKAAEFKILKINLLDFKQHKKYYHRRVKPCIKSNLICKFNSTALFDVKGFMIQKIHQIFKHFNCPNYMQGRQ